MDSKVVAETRKQSRMEAVLHRRERFSKQGQEHPDAKEKGDVPDTQPCFCTELV